MMTNFHPNRMLFFCFYIYTSIMDILHECRKLIKDYQEMSKTLKIETEETKRLMNNLTNTKHETLLDYLIICDDTNKCDLCKSKNNDNFITITPDDD